MYFDKSISTTNTSPTTTTITSTNSTRRNPTKKEIRVVYFPNIPINVHSVDLDQKCNMTLNANNPPNRFQQISPPLPSFDTMDKEMFKNFEHNDLSGQRGSGCCTRIQKNQIPTTVATTATTTTKTSPSSHNNNNDDDDDDDVDDDTLLVAIVHVKTKPGIVRKGGQKYTYLSNFIAFLPREPYTVVARSGFFCLGYPSQEEMLGTNEDVLFDSQEYHTYFRQASPLRMKDVTLANCPRIHFVMGMIDKVKTTTTNHHHHHKNQQQSSNGSNDTESDSVIISYGVQDCLSRFVEVKKVDIIDMFYGNQQGQSTITEEMETTVVLDRDEQEKLDIMKASFCHNCIFPSIGISCEQRFRFMQVNHKLSELDSFTFVMKNQACNKSIVL